MRVSAAWILIFLSACALGAPAQELPEAAAARARGATVCVRSPKGAGAHAGSGFLSRKDALGGIILTEAWCVGTAGMVEVVFHLGEADEKVVRGCVIAVDPSRSLATIRIAGTDLPEVIPLGPKTELRETEGVYSAGHPGVDVAAASGLRFLHCVVSSIRRDAHSQICAIQLAGDITIGDTGAPLLDKTGRCVGVTVGKIPGTQTAFAIPLEDVQGFLAGDWVEIVLTASSVTDSKSKVEIVATVFNPIGAARSITLAWGRKDRCNRPKEPLQPDKEGSWVKAWSLSKETTLQFSAGTAEATVEVERLNKERATDLVLQLKVGDGSKSRWLEPLTAEVEFAEGKALHYLSPRKCRVVSAPDAAPPAALLPALVTGAAFPEVGRLARLSVLGEVHLSPDGKDLLVLDRCEGRVLRVDPSTMVVKAEVEAQRGVVGLAVSPDWKTLWVASEQTMRSPEPNHSPEPMGVAQRFSLPGLEAEPPMDLPCAPAEFVATDAGVLLICDAQSGEINVFDAGKRVSIGRARGGRGLALGANQRVVYFLGGVRNGPAGLPVAAIPNRETPGWSYAGEGSAVAEDLAVSPDGQWVVLSNGFAGALTGTKAGDFQEHYTFEPGLAVVVAPGSSTFFESTDRGTLREYEFGDFKLKREIELGAVLRDMQIDSARRRLYAVVTPPDTAPPPSPSKPRLSHLVVYSLSDK